MTDRQYTDLASMLNNLSDYEPHYFADDEREDGIATRITANGEEVNLDEEIALAGSRIESRVKYYNNVKARLAEIKGQRKLDREFPEMED